MEDNHSTSTATRQITFGGKVTAGILLVIFTLFAIFLIIGFWPDRLPEPGKKCALYRYDWFDMSLDTAACNPAVAKVDTTTRVMPEKAKATTVVIVDSLKKDSTGKKDTIRPAVALTKKDSAPARVVNIEKKVIITEEPVEHIHLNTILLILVAAAGFLGNMIHIATSFTTYVGAGKFQQSWILWYWVRPFTASALALTLYFAFGGANDPGNVDLDRTLTMAVLAGLFTDIATQKLKEIFEVTFNPKDTRPDKLDNGPLITAGSIKPDKWDKAKENKVSIVGKNLKSKKLAIKIGDAAISNATITDDEITFAYTLTDADKAKATLTLLVTDEAGKELAKKAIPVGDSTPTGKKTTNGAAGDTTANDTSDTDDAEGEEDTDEDEEKPVG